MVCSDGRRHTRSISGPQKGAATGMAMMKSAVIRYLASNETGSTTSSTSLPIVLEKCCISKMPEYRLKFVPTRKASMFRTKMDRYRTIPMRPKEVAPGLDDLDRG